MRVTADTVELTVDLDPNDDMSSTYIISNNKSLSLDEVGGLVSPTEVICGTACGSWAGTLDKIKVEGTVVHITLGTYVNMNVCANPTKPGYACVLYEGALNAYLAHLAGTGCLKATPDNVHWVTGGSGECFSVEEYIKLRGTAPSEYIECWSGKVISDLRGVDNKVYVWAQNPDAYGLGRRICGELWATDPTGYYGASFQGTDWEWTKSVRFLENLLTGLGNKDQSAVSIANMLAARILGYNGPWHDLKVYYKVSQDMISNYL